MALTMLLCLRNACLLPDGLESCELESDVLESGKLDSGELGSSVVGSGKLASSSSSSRLERYKLGSGKLKCNGGCEEAAQEEEPGDSEGEEDAELERPSGGRLLRQLQARLAALEQQQQHSDELVQVRSTVVAPSYYPLSLAHSNYGCHAQCHPQATVASALLGALKQTGPGA